ncbi:hypothetical protein D3C73_1440500 [compost metagenome]
MVGMRRRRYGYGVQVVGIQQLVQGFDDGHPTDRLCELQAAFDIEVADGHEIPVRAGLEVPGQIGPPIPCPDHRDSELGL